MSEIKAIETSYAGYRFRSRLEARHAVFFDALGIDWVYEPEGFNLDGMCYLPDFWLPELNLWVEVKADGCDTLDDRELCRRLCLSTGSDVMMSFGAFCPVDIVRVGPDDWDTKVVGSNMGWYRKKLIDHNDFDDGLWTFAECMRCGKIGAHFFGQHKLCDCRCDPAPLELETVTPPWGNPWQRTRCTFCQVPLSDLPQFASEKQSHQVRRYAWSKRILAAYAAARSARFEHGESGAGPARRKGKRR